MGWLKWFLELESRGVVVIVGVLTLKFVLISPKNRTVYNFRGDLLKEIIAKGYEVIVVGPNRDDIEKVEELGVRFELIPLDKTGLNIVADLRYLLAVYRFFRREKPHVTLGYTIKPVIYGAIAARLARVKNVYSMVTGAGYLFTAKTAKARVVRVVASMLYKISFRCADAVIFQNNDDLHDFAENRLVEREKCRVVNGSGVNMDEFRHTCYPGKLTFFMLSRVIYSKGIREYLQAARKVKAEYPELRFMLLGAVENMPDSLSMDELIPYIDDGTVEYFPETDDVTSYYHECSVYVLPSYREGTPRTVLEAMAMKRPIITTDAPGCRETVVDGENGFLVPVRDVDALAEAMKWFVRNQDKIAIMGQASYELCREKFDANKVNQKMMEHMSIH